MDSGDKMSNLCSRIVSKPPKRPTEARDSMSVAQTNAWMNGKGRIFVNKILIYSNRMILILVFSSRTLQKQVKWHWHECFSIILRKIFFVPSTLCTVNITR